MRCSAKTKAGKRCRRNAIDGERRCRQHADDDVDQLTIAAIFERYEVPPDCTPLVQAYAELHKRRAAASASIDRDGLQVTNDEGVVFANPSVAIERQTSAELARIHREIVRSSTPITVKPKKSQLDELAEKREARRARPAAATD